MAYNCYDEQTKKILGQNIWMRREVLGISRGELEKRLGVSKGMVSNWELGKMAPRKEKIRNIAKELKCSISDLFSEKRLAVLSLTDLNKVEEPVIEKPIEVESKGSSDISRVADKLNEYVEKYNTSIYKVGRTLGIPDCSIWRIQSKKASIYNDTVRKLEKYLDEKLIEEPKQELKIEEPKTTPTVNKPVEVSNTVVNATISDRLNNLYETLFNSLDELDKLKEDIAKIEQVTTLLKQIDL